MIPVGRWLIVIGVLLVIIGVLVSYTSILSFLKIGRLPGDIHIRRGNFQFYFPLTTCIALSVVLTLIVYILKK
jgi:uncharacterized membrane protein YidH (DUF202 family)